VKSSLLATRARFVPFISLLLFGIVIWNFSALAVAQSLVPDDVKHDTPGQVVKQGQAVHIDVDLALVNVTVTDPYNRLVTGLVRTLPCRWLESRTVTAASGTINHPFPFPSLALRPRGPTFRRLILASFVK
jgi:hypothetical protein